MTAKIDLPKIKAALLTVTMNEWPKPCVIGWCGPSDRCPDCQSRETIATLVAWIEEARPLLKALIIDGSTHKAITGAQVLLNQLELKKAGKV